MQYNTYLFEQKPGSGEWKETLLFTAPRVYAAKIRAENWITENGGGYFNRLPVWRKEKWHGVKAHALPFIIESDVKRILIRRDNAG